MRRLPMLIPTVLALTISAVAAPAAADAAAAKAPKPTIKRVTPMRLSVGELLTIRGTNFKAKPRRNTVVFTANSGRTAFVKPLRATRRKLVVKVPASVARLLTLRDGAQQPTRLKLRVLAGRFSAFTPRRLSPVVLALGGGSGPGGGGPLAVCNKDADHDNDLLTNQFELEIGTDPCLMDTDGDTIEDGYEYQSARDLNDDELQDPNSFLPYPGKRPYPNPLDSSDADVDFDRDSLALGEEQSLWRHAVNAGRSARTLSPLYYSDGEQYSINQRNPDGRRKPTLPAAGYERQQSFLGWAAGNGYRNVVLVGHGEPWWDPSNTAALYGLLDFDRDGAESPTVQPGYALSETAYYDLLPDGYLSDDERDEDADGLTNYDETHGRMTPAYWKGCYAGETAFGIAYSGTDVVDPDTDGDGILDGADDQDHDDIPNVMELSRRAASGLWDAQSSCKAATGLPPVLHPDAYGRVNPFNPCLPEEYSRTCTLHPGLAGESAPYDGSPNWYSLN
jgi:hypothetical protein